MGGDVVGADVQENAVAEVLTVGAVDLVGLAADLGGDYGQLALPGLGKELLHFQRLGGGQMGVGHLTAQVMLHAGEKAGLGTGHSVHNGAGHIGGGGFSLGAGDAHQGKGTGGVVIEPLGGQALGLARIADQNGGQIALQLLLGQVTHGSGLLGLGQVLGLKAVALADEQVTGFDGAGVIADAQNVHISANALQQQAVSTQNRFQCGCLLHHRSLLFYHLYRENNQEKWMVQSCRL